VEWLLVVGVMLAMLLAYRMVCALALVPQPSFGLAFVQFLWTAAAYPVALFLSQLAFGLHKPAMGELDDRGRRL
jgi:rod shape-determining protein MreD